MRPFEGTDTITYMYLKDLKRACHICLSLLIYDVIVFSAIIQRACMWVELYMCVHT